MPNPVLRPPPKATLKPNSKQQLLSCTCRVRRGAAEACCREQARRRRVRWREGFLTLRCGGRRSTSQRSRQRSRHNGPPRARKGCHPRRTGASWGSACGAGVGGRLTNLVHLAKLLLQVLLGHASETRVDHLNNLPERSRREKLRCGGGRRALNDRRGAVMRGAAHKLLALQQSVRDELLRPDRHRTLRHGGEVPAATRVMW